MLGSFTSERSATAAPAAGAIPREEPSRADLLAERIRGGVSVNAVRDSRMVNISYQSEQPDFARLVVNTIAEAYKEEVMAMQMEASGYALKWMTQKAEEERGHLARAERALQDYMRQHDIVTVEDKVTVLPQQLSELTSKLAEAQAQKNVVGNVYRQIEEVRAAGGAVESLPVIAGNRELQTIRDNIRKAEQTVAELSQRYGPRHPAMIEARGALNDLMRQKNSEVARSIAAVKSELDVAEAQEATLRAALAGVKAEAQDLNERLTEYNVLKRDVDTNRALYDALIIQAKEKGVTENTQKVNVWTTEVAQTPKAPIKPNTKRNLLLGVVLGLFGGIGCAFFIEYLDNTVKDPEEAERRFDLSVVGVIELLKKGENPDVFITQEPSSSFAESYKSLRTAVLLSAAERPPKRLMVTSMSPQEGKTTTAMNLARALAQTERKVLLVDADLRRPRLHKAFQLENGVGLSSYLSGAIAETSVQATAEPFLSVLTSGPIPPNPSELLGSQRFGDLLAAMESRFDMIIIDSPPVLSATDSMLISALAESVLVVCHCGVTTYDRLQRGLKSIGEVNPHILGLVLNAMDMKKSNYYSYYGYYQYSSNNKEA